MDEKQVKNEKMMFGTGNLNIKGNYGGLWRGDLNISFTIAKNKKEKKESKLGFIDN
jgi:hypothetical protein